VKRNLAANEAHFEAVAGIWVIFFVVQKGKT